MGRVTRYAVNDAVFMFRYAASTIGFLLLFTLFYATLPISRALHDVTSAGMPARLAHNVVMIIGVFTATMIALFVAAVASNIVEREKADGAIEYVLASTSLGPREYLEAKMLSAVILSLPVALAFAASNGYVLMVHGVFDPEIVASLLIYTVLASAAFTIASVAATLALPQRYTMLLRFALVLTPVILLGQAVRIAAEARVIDAKSLLVISSLAIGLFGGASYVVARVKAQSIIERSLA